MSDGVRGWLLDLADWGIVLVDVFWAGFLAGVVLGLLWKVFLWGWGVFQ